MKRMIIVGICLTTAAFVFVSDASSQRIPGSVKKVAAQNSSCGAPNISVTKIGPRKTGWIAVCGDTEGVIFERTPKGLKELLRFNSPMRSQWSFSDRMRAHKGYYDFGWGVLSGGGVYVTTYRWNGTKYVLLYDDVFEKL